jgi:propanol-preferring alcohol dehydrogenase
MATELKQTDNVRMEAGRKAIHICSHMKMKAAQISKPGGNFELVERDIPEPGDGQVRVKVEACGICHSDVLVKDGLMPGIQYPRVPGHEIAGRIDGVGNGVTQWAKDQRVGVGWHGGHCFVCALCRSGDFAMCVKRKVTGIDFLTAATRTT